MASKKKIKNEVKKSEEAPVLVPSDKPGNEKTKTPFYFYIILVLIPVIFFALLEIGLRVFNYDDDLSMWIPAEPGMKIINPDVAKRYFTSVKNVPMTIEDIFDSSKAQNGFRVFVLGESSAAGYPYMPMGSFSRYLRKRLEISYPKNKIEVVNIGLTAVNSYTIRDFIPEVLKQQPDLIIIYTGHNEYYGALGVGSLESLGKSRALINLYLSLSKFKTVELLKDFLQWFTSLFSGNEPKRTGTLMSRMAKDQSIPYQSENFLAGVDQFKGNMEDVIDMCREAKVHLIIGTLASNLKDQKPFISKEVNSEPSAQSIYDKATDEYNKGNFKRADSLYRLAKDLDLLRFRAPEKINSLIREFGKSYNLPIVDIDSLFNAVSPNGIVGNNLMTDHLHPTLQGFKLIGKTLYDAMNKLHYLPKGEPVIPYNQQDSLTRANFVFSDLDSVVAEYRIMYLKNDWPFINPELKKSRAELFHPKTYTDTLAVKILSEENTWPEAHQLFIKRMRVEKNWDLFLKHSEVLIYQYPVVVEFYNEIDNAALELLGKKDYDNAYKLLIKRYELKPNDFSTKWLGNIDLSMKRISSAVKYLEESIRYNPSDIQTLYNLAGAYAMDKQYNKSFETINKVLTRDQNYPGAQQLLSQLQSLIK